MEDRHARHIVAALERQNVLLDRQNALLEQLTKANKPYVITINASQGLTPEEIKKLIVDNLSTKE